MTIQIFTKAPNGITVPYAIQDLLHDAGFSDATFNSSSTGNTLRYTSGSGVYGCKSFSIYSAKPAAKYTAIKDDSRKALIILPEFTGKTIKSVPACEIVTLAIVDGVTTFFADSDLAVVTNVISGNVKSSTDSSDALLSPLIGASDHILTPFYVALNRVIHPINTVVTDGTNSFTSLGNLLYIKNA